MPVAFLSHGSPMFAVQPGTTGPAFAHWGRELRERAGGRQLKAVVIMSPHWQTRQPMVGTAARPATLHDFGGFPPALYALRYPAPGAPALAARVIEMLSGAGFAASGDAERPLDHGAWVPLMHLFADAQVPVVQVALPLGFGPAEVAAMGAALRPLREEGVLLLGSGSMTHNLGEFFSRTGSGGATGDTAYVERFARWVEQAVVSGDRAGLLDYRSRAPDAARAHPEEDHFLPLFFALGAAGPGACATRWLSREVVARFLAMDSFVLEPIDGSKEHAPATQNS